MNTVMLTIALRRLLKITHTLGATGFMGGMAALLAVLVLTPAAAGRAEWIPVIEALAKIAAWVVAPSMVVTVISGLLSMAANPAFYEAGWVWVKAATGILILEGGLHVLGPIQEEAKRGAGALAGGADAAGIVSAEVNTMWVLLAVAAANVALGVWRPRFMRLD
ncbi:hypothetical protein BH09PSE2_BH09PSE2_02910 [soil metagenome]